MYLSIKRFSNGKPIIFGSNNLRTPYSVSMSEQHIRQAFSGKRLVPEGMFIASVNNVAKFLPRTKLVNATVTTTPTITLKAPCFQFTQGDVLYANAGYGELIFAGNPAASDVVTVVINNINYAVTVGASPTPVTVAAAWITANSSALTTAGITATQRASTGSVILTATDAHKVFSFSSNGNFRAELNSTEPGCLGSSILPLGTILAIGNPDVNENRIITLAANSSMVLPANISVGVKFDEILGIYPDPLDFTDEPVMHIAPICGADGVYENNLPYIDKEIKSIMSDLKINNKFFKL